MATVAQTGDTLVEPQSGRTRSGAARLDAIDMLRGLVIALMVLDHVRDFFHYDALRFDPTDPSKTWLALYLTRWVTHLCAPTFVFLAGASIWFQHDNGKTGAALSAFLVKRGLWLLLLEVTVISFGFNFAEPFLFLQVIWAIGMGMICMAAISRLPTRAVLGLGIALVALCPFAIAATDGATGAASVARALFLAPNLFLQVPALVVYPVLPWLGIMCIGFGLAPIFRSEPAQRRRHVLQLAIGMLALFVMLRTINLYGDPASWQHLPSMEQTLFSYFQVSKYPPSPDYVLVTLGVSLLLFLGLEHLRGPLARVLLAFGRTPLFTYLCHLYIAHGLMLVVALAMGFPAAVATDVILGGKTVAMNWGFPLWGAWLVWLTVLALLYPLSRWFEGIKRRRRDWWLSYL